MSSIQRITQSVMHVQPTGEYFDIHGFQSFRIRDGKIVEFHSVGDMLDAIEQLGAELGLK